MNNTKAWEWIGYINLVLCIVGQITVGYFYIFAQCLYLVANGIGVARQFILKRPIADKTKRYYFFCNNTCFNNFKNFLKNF